MYHYLWSGVLITQSTSFNRLSTTNGPQCLTCSGIFSINGNKTKAKISFLKPTEVVPLFGLASGQIYIHSIGLHPLIYICDHGNLNQNQISVCYHLCLSSTNKPFLFKEMNFQPHSIYSPLFLIQIYFTVPQLLSAHIIRLHIYVHMAYRHACIHTYNVTCIPTFIHR